MLNPKLSLQLSIITAILLAGCSQKPAAQKPPLVCCDTPATHPHRPSTPREDLMDPIILQNAISDIDTFEKSLPWKPFRPGVQIARVYNTPNNGPSAAFLKYDPGASVPLHMHGGYEHIIILKGSQVDRSGEHAAGSILINPPGSSHKVSSPNGCIIFIVWEKPVIITGE